MSTLLVFDPLGARMLRVAKHKDECDSTKYYSISELAQRWQCSRGTVYNRLRSVGAEVLDFASRGKKGRKVVSADGVLKIESRNTKRLC
jgi:hypothetical protein